MIPCRIATLSPYLDISFQASTFHRLADELRRDALADIDPRIAARRHDLRTMQWIVCGAVMTHEMRWMAEHFDVVAFVDDWYVGEEREDRPVISTEMWIDRIKADPKLASVVMFETPDEYDHYYRVALCFDAPVVSLLQMERLARAEGVPESKPWAHFSVAFFDEVLTSCDRLERVAAMLDEPFSRLSFYSALNYRLTRNPGFLRAVTVGEAPAYRKDEDERIDAQVFGYFAYQHDRRFIELGADDILVDGGAFDGVSMIQMARATRGKFRRLDVYEPQPSFLEKCKASRTAIGERFGEDVAAKIRLHGAGLWSERTTLEFQADFYADEDLRDPFWSPLGAHLVESGMVDPRATGATRVPVVTIDDESPDATFIKLEIEGAELRALHGARKTLVANRPKLSIAAYHKPADLFELPEFLGSLDLDYTLGFRHHHPTLFISSVFYAVPNRKSV